jgi:hypothetical protein
MDTAHWCLFVDADSTHRHILDPTTTYEHLVELLRSSAPAALDVPATHTSAQALLSDLFATGPHDPMPDELVPHVEDALSLAREFQMEKVCSRTPILEISSSSLDPSRTLLLFRHYCSLRGRHTRCSAGFD